MIFLQSIFFMVNYKRHILDNGMVVLLNQDKTTPLVSFNILYNAGSKYENEKKTGLAHLFEHLMFAGTEKAPDFDYFTQMAGGENNAFTNADIVDFYITVPSENIETAFWLEADRMQNLVLDSNTFENEKRVVIEEFKETTLNIPYGDMWHHLSSLAYTIHPYKWPTIGKEIEHIENITLNDALEFYRKFYHPANAILALSGNFNIDEALNLAQKWFGGIEKPAFKPQTLPQEPVQSTLRKKIVHQQIPSNAVYLAFHVAGRLDLNYYTHDLLSDILGRGRSSRLFQNLVKKEEVFNEISAYISGNIDPGLLVIEGLIPDEIEYEFAIEKIREELSLLKKGEIKENELQKLKNKIENQMAFSEINILNKAMNLAQYDFLGDASLINKQIQLYESVSLDKVISEANNIFDENNCIELVYLKN
ncbi:MAG TPA: insulinase family protein [Bacteroidetes bacterium]|nr:insulinase family protein [Bacteroidota bacterium]